MTTPTIVRPLDLLDRLTLSTGSHDAPPPDADIPHACLLEAVAWMTGGDWTDTPACVCPVLVAFGQRLNDVLPDDTRQRLVPLIPRLVGTAGDGRAEARSYLALDWLIRTYTPMWLDLAGLTAEATALRGLRQIVDLVAAERAGPVVRVARDRAAAAWDAAWDAAGDAAWDAAWDAARAAAWAAAGAAWAAAGDAWAAAGDARAAAWAAARDAAGAAAWAAARDAAGDAAGDALAPTVAQLQDSAIALFEQMIDPTAVS